MQPTKGPLTLNIIIPNLRLYESCYFFPTSLLFRTSIFITKVSYPSFLTKKRSKSSNAFSIHGYVRHQSTSITAWSLFARISALIWSKSDSSLACLDLMCSTALLINSFRSAWDGDSELSPYPGSKPCFFLLQSVQAT